MRTKQSLIRLAPCFLVLLAIVEVRGQSSLFNIPTTDVQERGATYVEVDFDTHIARSSQDRWQSFGGMVIRGVGKRTEVGLNIYGLRTSGGFEPLELQPNLKINAYQNESNGFAVSVGAIGYLPLAKRFYKDSSVSVYAVASKTFKSNWTPRITGGGYQLIGRNADGGDTRGFLIGIEQPIVKRLTFMADWNTAKNRLGYAAAGFGLDLTKRSSLYSAYYFGNTGRGNNWVGIYYGLNF